MRKALTILEALALIVFMVGAVVANNASLAVVAALGVLGAGLGGAVGTRFFYRVELDLAVQNQHWAAQGAERHRLRAEYWQQMWCKEVGSERAAAHLAALDAHPELEAPDPGGPAVAPA